MDNENSQKMAWNDPGKGGQDPWSGKQNNSDELMKLIENVKTKFNDLFGSGGGAGGTDKNSSSLVGVVLLVLVVLWGLSGIYIIEPAERGVVLRFGDHVDTTLPGPHWHYPYPIETVEAVDVEKVRTITIGYRDATPGDKFLRGSGDVLSESLMLTKDENIINAKFAVQYRIKSPENYLFNVMSPERTLKQATESAVREVVGRSNMDFVITEGRAEVAGEVEILVQKILDKYESGILVTQVTMKSAEPPDQVQEAFADVFRAQEDNKKFVNQAEAYRNDIIPKARGQVARIIADANAYKEQVVAKAEGETSRFNQILNEYRKAPKVTKKRMYLDTMQEVLGNTGKVILDAKEGNALTLLPVDKLLSAGAIQSMTSKTDNKTLSTDTNTNNNAEQKPGSGRSSRGGR